METICIYKVSIVSFNAVSGPNVEVFPFFFREFLGQPCFQTFEAAGFDPEEFSGFL